MVITIDNYQNISKVCLHDKLLLPLNSNPDYSMWVESSFLADGRNNHVIFDELGVNKYNFCMQAYGYRPYEGGCPECNPGDYDALTRLVKNLFACYEMQIKPPKVLTLSTININLLIDK